MLSEVEEGDNPMLTKLTPVATLVCWSVLSVRVWSALSLSVLHWVRCLDGNAFWIGLFVDQLQQYLRQFKTPNFFRAM